MFSQSQNNSSYELNAIKINSNGTIECDVGDDESILKCKLATTPGFAVIPPNPPATKKNKTIAYIDNSSDPPIITGFDSDLNRDKITQIEPGEIILYCTSSNSNSVITIKNNEISISNGTNTITLNNKIVLSGNVEISGTLTTSGNITSQGEIECNNVKLSTHKHIETGTTTKSPTPGT
jgi:phage baseplate assembly protein gpV